MPLKAAPTTATTLKLIGDISIADTDSQIVTIGQLQFIINQLIGNGQALENKINKIGMSKVKMPLIKRFSGEKAKLKGFLTQIKLKIRHEGQKLPIVINQVVYTGLFLTKYTFKQFKLYLVEYKANSLTTKNNKV